MSIIQLLFSLKGRLRRRDWWWANVALNVISFSAEFGGYMVITGKPLLSFFNDDSASNKKPFDAYAIFSWTLTALLAWPFLCVSAKRWHDRNRSGWLAVAVLLVTYAILVVREAGGYVSWSSYMTLVFVIVALNIWQLVECDFLEGTIGPNRYGPSPKRINSAEDVF